MCVWGGWGGVGGVVWVALGVEPLCSPGRRGKGSGSQGARCQEACQPWGRSPRGRAPLQAGEREWLWQLWCTLDSTQTMVLGSVHGATLAGQGFFSPRHFRLRIPP